MYMYISTLVVYMHRFMSPPSLVNVLLTSHSVCLALSTNSHCSFGHKCYCIVSIHVYMYLYMYLYMFIIYGLHVHCMYSVCTWTMVSFVRDYVLDR